MAGTAYLEQTWKTVKKLRCKQKRRNLTKAVTEPIATTLFLLICLAAAVFMMYAGCCEAATEYGLEIPKLPYLWEIVKPYTEQFLQSGGDTQLMLPLGVACIAPLAAGVAGLAVRIIMILLGLAVLHPDKKAMPEDEAGTCQNIVDLVAVMESRGKDGTVTKRIMLIGSLAVNALVVAAGAFYTWKNGYPLESVFGTALLGLALIVMHLLCRIIVRWLTVTDSRAYGAAEYARAAQQRRKEYLAQKEEERKNARKAELLELLKAEKWEEASAMAEGLDFEDETVAAAKQLLRLTMAAEEEVGEAFLALEHLLQATKPEEAYRLICWQELEMRRIALEDKAAERADAAFDLFLKHEWEKAAQTASMAAAVGNPDAAVVYVAASMQICNEPSEYGKWFDMVDKATKKGVSRRFKETAQFTKEIVGQAYYANLARKYYLQALEAREPKMKRDLMQAAAAYGSKEAKKYLDDLASYTRTRVNYSPASISASSNPAPGSGAYGYPEELGPGYNPVSGEGI